jgi:hypothetical protein
MATKERKPHLRLPVCKPCWELRYCPYGPLVEYFPLPSDELPLSQVRKSHRTWVDAVRSGRLNTRSRIYAAIEKLLCLDPKWWEWITQWS